jgi:5-methylcytosine-specific restriction protein A
VTPAEISDHITPHGGDVNAFLLGRLQSLCRHHHESTKKMIAHRGYDPAIGADGMPLDRRYPIYRYY